MKKIFTIITFITITVCNSQEKIEINYLYKEWRLETLEKNGKVKSAEEFNKDETIVFYKNNKFKMKDSEAIMNGIWKFNYLDNTIELTLVDINQKIELKVLKLNSNEFDYISKDDDSFLIFHFKPKI